MKCRCERKGMRAGVREDERGKEGSVHDDGRESLKSVRLSVSEPAKWSSRSSARVFDESIGGKGRVG